MAGAVGSFGGPVTAAVGLGAVGISEVAMAYVNYRRCKKEAEKEYQCGGSDGSVYVLPDEYDEENVEDFVEPYN